MKKIIPFALAFVSALTICTAEIDEKAVSDLELNISVLTQQFDFVVTEINRRQKLLPAELGAYEGLLVGRYQLETQIRKQAKKLAALKGDEDYSKGLDPEIEIYNPTELKLLVTVNASNPKYDLVEYFLFQDMTIHFPIDGFESFRVSDFREDDIYPLYKVEAIDMDKKLVLGVESATSQ